jgi:hypothetical protein
VEKTKKTLLCQVKMLTVTTVAWMAAPNKNKPNFKNKKLAA